MDPAKCHGFSGIARGIEVGDARDAPEQVLAERRMAVAILRLGAEPGAVVQDRLGQLVLAACHVRFVMDDHAEQALSIGARLRPRLAEIRQDAFSYDDGIDEGFEAPAAALIADQRRTQPCAAACVGTTPHAIRVRCFRHCRGGRAGAAQ